MNNKPTSGPQARPAPVKTGGDAAVAMLRQAFGLHQQGRLDEAERLYRNVLAMIPRHADALHFLGVLEAQRGRFDPALELMDRALAIAPGNAAMHYNRANLLRDMGRLPQALAGYDAALAVKSDNLAVLNNRGAVLQALGRHQDALASYDRVLALKPDHPDAAVNRGNALVELDRAHEALGSYDRALAAAPKHVAALYGRGNALAKLRNYDEALLFYDRASALAPDNPQLLNNRGNVLSQLGRPEAALASFDRAIAAAPDKAESFGNRGNVLMPLRRYEEALASFDRALALKRDDTDALYGRASALVELKRHDEAIDAFERLLRERPDYPYALGMLVYAQRTCCDWRDDSAIPAMNDAVRAGQRAATPLVLLAVSDSGADKRTCSETLMRDKLPRQTERLWQGQHYDHARIRLAYVSADLRMHPVAILMADVFERHDRSRFEIIALSHGADDGSEMRRRLMGAFDRFVDVQGKSDSEIATLIRELEIDIAVDLTGLTASARPGILALRPAPVQVNYLGFAGTFGGTETDYMIADPVVAPEEQADFYAEKIVHLPDCFMPHDSKRRIAERTPSRQEAGLPERGFVFASFNNSYKFNPPVFDVWMRLLRAVPGSVLWLPSANSAAMRNLAREAETRGVAAERIVFAPHLQNADDHLARLRLADLFLDTLPYNAHTTASDALWVGLPVLTCMGESFASRVAASLLHAAGLPELITGSLPAYEEKALALARDPVALAAIRAKLAVARKTCALFDTERFIRNLESAYVTMWERAQRNEAPAAFKAGDRRDTGTP